MRDLLDDAALAAALDRLDGWTGDRTAVRRTVTARSFRDAIALLTAVADAAEDMDHHPDIDVRWRTVTFALTTHSAGGVTEMDVALAEKIDALVPAYS